MLEAIALFLIGVCTGAYGVIVGVGGGVILVPLLLLFFDIRPEVVAGTSLAVVALNSLSGSFAYHRMKMVDVRSGLLFAAVAIPGSVLAPFVVSGVAGDLFKAVFGALLFMLAVYLLVRRKSSGNPSSGNGPEGAWSWMYTSRRITSKINEVFEYRFNRIAASGFSAVLGFLSAFFGVGGGFLMTPALITVFGFPVRVGIATSIFYVSIIAMLGSMVHASLGHIEWYPTFLWVGLGMLVGGQIGVRLASRMKVYWILRLLAVLLFVLGARLLWQGMTT